MTSAGASGLQRVPALDGLRGVAVLAVLLFHDHRLPGGFLGVDLFFVLSGFLITSLLIAEHEATGRIDLRRFWARRATRLLPASFLMLAVVATVLALTGNLERFRGQIAASVFQVANWHSIVSARNYWDLFKSPSPFEHMWSLAIEEQFYLAWPLIVGAVLCHARTRRWLGVACLALIALSCWRFGGTQAASHSRAYFGTDTRAQALLVGALVACWKAAPDSTSPLRLNLVTGLGAALFVVATCTLTGESGVLYRGGFTVFAVGAALLVSALANGKSLASKALSWRPLTALGGVSYGVYLWHWPVFCWLAPDHVKTEYLAVLTLLRFAVTLAMALLSYWLLEQPLRTRRAPRYAHRYVVIVASVFGCVASLKAVSYASPPPHHALVPSEPGRIPDPVELQIVVVGDSTANSLGWGIRGARKRGVAVELLGQDGCTMLADTCGGASWAQRSKELRSDAVLVFLGGAFMHGLSLDGQWRKACYRGWDSAFQGTLAKRFADLRAMNARVWAVTVPYALGPWDSPAHRREVDCINASVRNASATVAGVKVLDLAERLCPQGVCGRDLDGVEIRPDGVHFSMEGATELSQWVLEQISR